MDWDRHLEVLKILFCIVGTLVLGYSVIGAMIWVSVFFFGDVGIGVVLLALALISGYVFVYIITS